MYETGRASGCWQGQHLDNTYMLQTWYHQAPWGWGGAFLSVLSKILPNDCSGEGTGWQCPALAAGPRLFHLHPPEG